MTEKNTNLTRKPARKANGTARYLIIAAIILAAFLGSYGIAVAKGKANAGTVQAAAPIAAPATTAALSGRPGATGGTACACCGATGLGSSAPTEGSAVTEGGVQKASVDLSTGSYNPSTIKLKAGVPAEITFGQSSGCTAQVQSQDLGFFEDLTSGPVTVNLPALKAGTYSFSCGMQMVFGSIIVE
ncbi:MAG: cupredoxin domain-containing protein [Actinomycetia bacterium]|nr:cupredoxin domain-containing protein [Actinomycetes bacterium]